MSIVILNGPNLNMLGIREPEIYGTESLDDIKNWLVDESGIDFQWFQSNSEGDLIDQIQTSQLEKTDIVINPGAFTHYSYGLHDALSSHKAAGLVSIECHLSNPAARESFRQNSVISPAVTGTIAGFGKNVYLLALQEIKSRRGN